MNSIPPELISDTLLEFSARARYCEDNRAESARLYREATERDLAGGRIASAMENKRWHGNSLMWDGRHDEALAVLLEVASCKCPEADPASIFTAKTDCIMIALYHASAAVIQELIASATDYLIRIGKPHWRHRLDLLKTILLCRQGRFGEALASAQQAHRLAKAAVDGPQYSNFAYLKWLSRPAYFLGQLPQIQLCLEEARCTPQFLASDGIRFACIRLQELRSHAPREDVLGAISGVARDCLPHVSPADYLWEEYYDAAHALLAAGEFDLVKNLPARQPELLRFESAALQADLDINLMRRQLGLPPWDAEMNHAETISSNLADTVALTQPDIKPLHNSLTQLELIAALEDERLETSYYSSTAKRRRRHTEALMRLRQHPSLPSAFT